MTQLVPNTAAVTARGTVSGKPWQNTFYVRDQAGGWTAANLQLVADTLRSAWSTHMAPMQSATVLATLFLAKDLGAINGLEKSNSTQVTGTRVPVIGANMPVMIAAAVKAKCTPGALPTHGFVYICGANEEDGGAVDWLAAYQSALDTAITNVYNALDNAAIDFSIVIPSRFDKVAVPVPPHQRPVAITNTIVDISVVGRMSSQRGRRV